MSLLKLYPRETLHRLLAEVAQPVTISYTAVDALPEDVAATLDQLAALSPLINVDTQLDFLVETDEVRIRAAAGGTLHFVGPPLGTEVAALVSAVVVAGRGDSGLATATRSALADLLPLTLRIFTTPT